MFYTPHLSRVALANPFHFCFATIWNRFLTTFPTHVVSCHVVLYFRSATPSAWATTTTTTLVSGLSTNGITKFSTPAPEKTTFVSLIMLFILMQ